MTNTCTYLETAKVTVDWFNIVLHSDDVLGLTEHLEYLVPDMAIENWQEGNCTRGYTKSLRFQGHNFIIISWNPTEENKYKVNMDHPTNKDILISLSGDGCRYLASFGMLSEFLKYCKSIGCHCTRFDTALDIFAQNELVSSIVQAFKSSVLARIGACNCISSNMHLKASNVQFAAVVDPFTGELTENVTFGNHGSSFGMFRCYNKAAEIMQGRLVSSSDEIFEAVGCVDYWYRLEYEVHKKNADKYFQMLLNALEGNEFDNILTNIFAQIAEDMFRIVSLKSLNSIPRQSATASLWVEFLSSISYIYPRVIDNLVSIPYIRRTDLKSVISNGSRIKGYFYALLCAFFSDDGFRKFILSEGREKFNSPHYSELRDTLPDIDIENILKEVA